MVRYKTTKFDPLYNSDTSKHNISRFQGGKWNNEDVTVKDEQGGTPLRT
jgi:hypothetical protein